MGACLITQPLDLVKNRMQLASHNGNGKVNPKTTFHVMGNIFRTEGVLAFYNGLSAGLFRQATYTTARLGVYTYLMEKFSPKEGNLSFMKKVSIGLCAGGIGAIFGTPADIVLIRMTADGRLKPKHRRGYNHVFDALFRMQKEEGITSLWRGCGPTVIRAMVVNAAQLSTYSQAKQVILSTGYTKDGIVCHFISSMISGLATTTTSMPVDMSKTRIQNMRIIDGKPEYRNAFHVCVDVVSREGFMSLWKGFTPYYLRIGPHTVLTFIFLEQLNHGYYKYVLGIEHLSNL